MTQTVPTRYKSFVFPSMLAVAVLAAAAVLPVLAQEGELDKSQPVGITPEEIVQKFAAKEKEFKTARDQYTYRQSVKVQVLDGNTVKGEYQQVFDVLFDDKGKHIENVVFAPQSTLENGGLSMDQGDFEDIRQRLPFVLTTDELPEYDVIYVGKQKQDELNTYAFDVAPKKIEGKKRYFQGRVWVDDHDFQIVKTFGKTVPDIRPGKKGQEHLYPSFATWREQIDDKYWFPTYTRADDTLHFATGDIRIREIVRYENYKRFGAKSRITYEGQEVTRGEEQKKDEQPPKGEDQKPQ